MISSDLPLPAGVSLAANLPAHVPLLAAFSISSLLLFVAPSLPRFGGTQHHRMNGLYETLCVILLFPIVVAIGAGEKRVDGLSIRVARFFGDLSYPLYSTHYPLTCMCTAWVVREKPTGAQGVLPAFLVGIVAVAIAPTSLKLYDESVRRWWSGRFLAKHGRVRANRCRQSPPPRNTRSILLPMCSLGAHC